MTPESRPPEDLASSTSPAVLAQARLQVHARFYRRATALLAAAFLATLLGYLYEASRPVERFVIAVQSGQAISVEPLTIASSDRFLVGAVAAWIQKVRTVSIDPRVNRDNYQQALDVSAPSLTTLLNSRYRAIAESTDIQFVNPRIRSILRTVDDPLRPVYQVLWDETTFYRSGKNPETETFQAFLTVGFLPDEDVNKDVIFRNPLGVVIHAVNWTRVIDA